MPTISVFYGIIIQMFWGIQGTQHLCAAGQGRVIKRVRLPSRKEGHPPDSESLGGLVVLSGFKRRTASRQAVSRKVEGFELRN
jgi:hypothetical protein